MKTSSLDILEGSELPDDQARAILKVLEQEMSSSQENLATKTDLEQLRLATKTDMEQLRLATKADMEQLRLATKADINAFGSKLAWMVLTCFLTQLAVTVALAGAFYVHFSR